MTSLKNDIQRIADRLSTLKIDQPRAMDLAHANTTIGADFPASLEAAVRAISDKIAERIEQGYRPKITRHEADAIIQTHTGAPIPAFVLSDLKDTLSGILPLNLLSDNPGLKLPAPDRRQTPSISMNEDLERLLTNPRDTYFRMVPARRRSLEIPEGISGDLEALIYRGAMLDLLFQSLDGNLEDLMEDSDLRVGDIFEIQDALRTMSAQILAFAKAEISNDKLPHFKLTAAPGQEALDRICALLTPADPDEDLRARVVSYFRNSAEGIHGLSLRITNPRDSDNLVVAIKTLGYYGQDQSMRALHDRLAGLQREASERYKLHRSLETAEDILTAQKRDVAELFRFIEQCLLVKAAADQIPVFFLTCEYQATDYVPVPATFDFHPGTPEEIGSAFFRYMRLKHDVKAFLTNHFKDDVFGLLAQVQLR